MSIVTTPNLNLKEELLSTDKYKKYLEFENQHHTLKELVKKIVYYDKEARSDYTKLLIQVWLSQNAIQFIIPMKDYNKMYKAESVSRVFRELMTDARSGAPELQFLLKDTETLDKRSNLEELNHKYYQENKLSEQAMILK